MLKLAYGAIAVFLLVTFVGEIMLGLPPGVAAVVAILAIAWMGCAAVAIGVAERNGWR